jgi:hypothetical protein
MAEVGGSVGSQLSIKTGPAPNAVAVSAGGNASFALPMIVFGALALYAVLRMGRRRR